MSQNNSSVSCQRRIIQFPVTRLVLALLVVILSVLLAQLIVALLPFDGETDWAGRVRLTQPIVTSLPFGLALQALLSAGITVLFSYGAFYAYVHFIERRDFTELAPAGALKELGSGMLVGALLFTATICVLAVLGMYDVSGINDWLVLIIPLTSSIISAFLEEIMFRGILFKIVEESLGTWLALLISATVFGLLHLGNPDATLVGSLAVIVNAGILLAAAYLFTRRLWLAIGIHFAWNFTQAGIFGVTDAQGLLRADLSGPAWLSGGDYGPEASVVTVVLCLVGGIYFVMRAIRQNHILQPSWQRAPSA
jgi:membrane protease YdiL (CAAX protease family)